MYCQIKSAAVCALEARLLEVECTTGSGLPSFTIVGIPAGTAIGIRERIRSALKSIGASLPPSRITVNIRSQHNDSISDASSLDALDLPVALSVLACQSLLPARRLEEGLWAGELGLDGRIKSMNGALSLALMAQKEPSAPPLFLPASNAAEAALCEDCKVYGLRTLAEAVEYLRGHEKLRRVLRQPAPSACAGLPDNEESPLLDDILGQEIAKRALTISAAGLHNLLFIGPPGCGKTLLARAAPGLMSPLFPSEQLELTQIYSAAGLLSEDQPIVTRRPFREPHHTITQTALTGGGAFPRPGEITLSHHGVLFLDELPEFSRASIEALREPLEDHTVRIRRLQASYTFPADFLLIASMNPCPCGYYPDRSMCHCRPGRIHDYYEKVKSPLFDRIDLIVPMKAVTPEEMAMEPSLTQEKARALIERALSVQQKRGQRVRNGRLTAQELERYAPLSAELTSFMDEAVKTYRLSMRGCHKVRKVARTIADMDGCEAIRLEHLAEALQYRSVLSDPAREALPSG